MPVNINIDKRDHVLPWLAGEVTETRVNHQLWLRYFDEPGKKEEVKLTSVLKKSNFSYHLWLQVGWKGNFFLSDFICYTFLNFLCS